MKEILQSKWDEILTFLQTQYNITQVSFQTWLCPLHIHDVKDNKIIISVDSSKIPSDAGIGFINNKYGLFIRTAIAEIINMDYEIEFISSNSSEPKKIPQNIINSTSSQKNQPYTLNPKYTFDNFVVSSNNQLAHAAALAVAESPSDVYNPLYIYGDVGLGKTHLMQAIAQYITVNNPAQRVRYVQSEKFTNDLIESIRRGSSTPPEFRDKYRNIDVLLIDDIQFIIGKERTQEEFFHTFNTLYEAKKQIVISSDKPPKDLITLEERLKSRFEWGLIVDMTIPDFETKMAILRKKNEINGVDIDDKILEYIAINIKSNVRELEGSLTKLLFLSRLQKREITMELAKEAVRDITNEKKSLSCAFIIDVVAEHFGISSAEIYSTSRSKNVSYPRQISMYLCKKYTSTTITKIGEILGRDHSTVLHGYNKIEADLESDRSLKGTIEIIVKKINPDEH